MARNTCPFDYLHDGIIILILCFLPFKEAARTSILSKRWRNLWTFTTNIQLTESNFVEEVDGEKKISKPAFLDFARRFLGDYQGKEIEKFSISTFWTNELRPLVEKWIEFAVSRDVKEIGLEFLENGVCDFALPLILLEHTSLTALMLTACIVDATDLVRFKLLKSLRLESIKLTSKAVQTVLKECHFLGSLTLKKCTGIDFLYISGWSLPLKNLVIDECELSKGFSICPNNLKYYKYFGTLNRYDYLELPSAVEVDLDFGMEKNYRNFGETLSEMLKGIYTTKTLTVCSYLLQVLPSGLDVLYLAEPLFISHLILKTGLHANELPGIASMIRSCPGLEALTIAKGQTLFLENFEYPYGPAVLSSESFWQTQKTWFQCFGGYLKTVTIQNFEMDDSGVLDLLAFLMVNARGLKTILLETSKLNPWSSWSSQARLLLSSKLGHPMANPLLRVLIS